MAGVYLESSAHEVAQAVVLDLDGTLTDVNACMTRTYNALDWIGQPGLLDRIQLAYTASRQEGRSFEPLTTIKHQLEPQAYREFVHAFTSDAQESIWYEDGLRLIQTLQDAKMPHMVLTRSAGTDPAWQALKLFASSFAWGGAKVIDHPYKALYAMDWYAGDGYYLHRTLTHSRQGAYVVRAAQLAIVDNDPKAFVSPHKTHPIAGNWCGFLVDRSIDGDALLELPPNVQAVGSLDELAVVDGLLCKSADEAAIAAKQQHKLSEAILQRTVYMPCAECQEKQQLPVL